MLLLLLSFYVALVAVRGREGAALFAVADAAELAFVHRIHLHRAAALHRPDLRMAFLAFKRTAVEVVAELDRRGVAWLVGDVLRHRDLCMTFRTVGPVRRLLAVMADEARLVLAMICKGNPCRTRFHGEYLCVAIAAFGLGSMCLMLEADGCIALAEGNGFRSGHAGMAMLAVGPVCRLFAVMAWEAGLVGSMVRKADLRRSGLHLE